MNATNYRAPKYGEWVTLKNCGTTVEVLSFKNEREGESQPLIYVKAPSWAFGKWVRATELV